MSINKKSTLMKFDNVCFGYEPNKQIIHNVSFNIYDNELIATVGANASGKSTLAKIIVGLFKPTKGSIYFQNQLIDKTNFELLKNNVGIVFENPDSQIIGFTAEDDIAFTLENKQVPTKEMKPIIEQIAQTVGIKDILTIDASTLSGGQKQKVTIASVLASNPKIIIFDEATSMLDASSKESLIKLMMDLKNIYKKTIIWITHDMDETIIADRIMVLNKGKIQCFDKPKVVFENDLTKYELAGPYVVELSKKIKGIKPCIELDTLVKEINNAK